MLSDAECDVLIRAVDEVVRGYIDEGGDPHSDECRALQRDAVRGAFPARSVPATAARDVLAEGMSLAEAYAYVMRPRNREAQDGAFDLCLDVVLRFVGQAINVPARVAGGEEEPEAVAMMRAKAWVFPYEADAVVAYIDTLQTALAEQRATAAGGAAAHLAWHHLASVECDHEARTDVAVCGCARWRSDPTPPIGEAITASAHHVRETRR